MPCSDMGGVGTEQGNRMVGGRGDGFKASDACGMVINEVVTGHVALGCGRLGGPSGPRQGRRKERRETLGRGGGKGGPRCGEKSGKNVVAIVNGGGKGGILNFGREERRGSRWIRWKKADKLESLGVGAVTSNAVVFGDGFVECG